MEAAAEEEHVHITDAHERQPQRLLWPRVSSEQPLGRLGTAGRGACFEQSDRQSDRQHHSPRLRVLLVHALLPLLEQADGLFGLLGQVLHEDPEVLVLPQSLHFALVAGQDGAQVLVGVWQQVQDVRGAVLQSQFGVLTQAHHLHEDRGCWGGGGGSERQVGARKKKHKKTDRWDRINTDVHNLEHRQEQVCITWLASGTAALMWNAAAKSSCDGSTAALRYDALWLSWLTAEGFMLSTINSSVPHEHHRPLSASSACLEKPSCLHILIRTDAFVHHRRANLISRGSWTRHQTKAFKLKKKKKN